MTYLHWDLDLERGETVEVDLDHQAYVRLLDGANFALYQQGRRFRYHGGFAERSPYRVTAPTAGHWHLVVDLGASAGRVRAAIRTLAA